MELPRYAPELPGCQRKLLFIPSHRAFVWKSALVHSSNQGEVREIENLEILPGWMKLAFSPTTFCIRRQNSRTEHRVAELLTSTAASHLNSQNGPHPGQGGALTYHHITCHLLLGRTELPFICLHCVLL